MPLTNFVPDPAVVARAATAVDAAAYVARVAARDAASATAAAAAAAAAAPAAATAARAAAAAAAAQPAKQYLHEGELYNDEAGGNILLQPVILWILESFKRRFYVSCNFLLLQLAVSPNLPHTTETDYACKIYSQTLVLYTMPRGNFFCKPLGW